ncbi:MAG: CapA family protein [Bacteroidales bacterium]|nr:CapA family protein [Bacteroidales bacterium]
MLRPSFSIVAYKVQTALDFSKKKAGKIFVFFTLSPVFLYSFISFLFFSNPSSISEDQLIPLPPPKQEVTLLFMGDIMQHMPQVEAAWNDSLNRYIYDSCFKYISPLIQGYDLAVANLETTLAGKPFSGYPAFSSPDELVVGMLNAGIDLVGTANNHCCDRGLTGVKRTAVMLDSLGLAHFGTYKNEKDYLTQNPKIVRKNGITLAFLNYTYGTNGIPVPEGTVVSLIEKDRIKKDMEAAHDSIPDKTIIFIHWGEEYQREPNAYQKEIAEYCFKLGADIIIGSHPHVIQPMEWHNADSVSKEKLVVWSLGNYVSNQRKRYTDGGAMVGITLQKINGNTTIKQADYQLSWVFNPLRNGKRQYYILPAKSFENDSVMLDKESSASLKTFVADSRELLSKNIRIPEK